MKYFVAGALLAGLAGCAWFGGGEDDDAQRTETGQADGAERIRVGHPVDDYDEGAAQRQWAFDPVTGERIPQDALFKTEWEGMTYYFSSEDSLEAFRKEPTAYVTEDGYLKKPLDQVQREAEVK